MNRERLENQGEYSVFPERFFSENEVKVLQSIVLDFSVFNTAEAIGISEEKVTAIKKTIGKKIISQLENMRGKSFESEEAPSGITIAAGLAAKRKLISDGLPKGSRLKIELSEMERKILVRTAFGFNRRQIASYLDTDFSTVNRLLQDIFVRFRANNREQLVAIAVSRGIV